VKGQREDANFCLEASYQCGLVGPGNRSKKMVFDLLELVPKPLSKKWLRMKGPSCRAASGDGWAHNSS
jgi:hypothetical protein